MESNSPLLAGTIPIPQDPLLPGILPQQLLFIKLTLPFPSAKDCFDQLDFQIKLLGNSDASYTPCVGLICAPYMPSAKTCDSSIVVYWAFPPPEGSPQDWGR